MEEAEACYVRAAAPRIARAEEGKAAGNALFNQGDHGGAALEYEAAIAELDYTAVAGLGVAQSAVWRRPLRSHTELSSGTPCPRIMNSRPVVHRVLSRACCV